MKKTFDKEKFNRIPWTVVGIVFVAVIAVITVIITAVGTWHSAAISVCALLLIVFISVAVVRCEIKRNVQDVLESQRIKAEKQAMELKLHLHCLLLCLVALRFQSTLHVSFYFPTNDRYGNKYYQ